MNTNNLLKYMDCDSLVRKGGRFVSRVHKEVKGIENRGMHVRGGGVLVGCCHCSAMRLSSWLTQISWDKGKKKRWSVLSH